LPTRQRLGASCGWRTGCVTFGGNSGSQFLKAVVGCFLYEFDSPRTYFEKLLHDRHFAGLEPSLHFFVNGFQAFQSLFCLPKFACSTILYVDLLFDRHISCPKFRRRVNAQF